MAIECSKFHKKSLGYLRVIKVQHVLFFCTYDLLHIIGLKGITPLGDEFKLMFELWEYAYLPCIGLGYDKTVSQMFFITKKGVSKLFRHLDNEERKEKISQLYSWIKDDILKNF